MFCVTQYIKLLVTANLCHKNWQDSRIQEHAVLQQDSAILWMDAQRSKPKRAWTELYQGWILASLGLFLEVDYLHVQRLKLLNPKAVKAIHALLPYCTIRCCKYTGLLTSVSPCCHDQSVWTGKPSKVWYVTAINWTILSVLFFWSSLCDFWLGWGRL